MRWIMINKIEINENNQNIIVEKGAQ